MASLIIQDIDDEIMEALKEQAKYSGCSIDAEIRKILSRFLLKPKKRTFAEVLASMPNVGLDSDFERQQDMEDRDVFD